MAGRRNESTSLLCTKKMGKDDIPGTKRDDGGMPIPAEKAVRNGRDEGGGKKQDQGQYRSKGNCRKG